MNAAGYGQNSVQQINCLIIQFLFRKGTETGAEGSQVELMMYFYFEEQN